MTTQKQKNTAILEMLVCATLWSIAGIFIKLIPWNAFVIAGLRSLFAGLVVLVYMKIRRLRLILNRRTVVAGVCMALLFFCFVGANKLTTAANAIVLQFTAPLFIMVLSVLFLHQKFRRADVLAVVFTMAGISLFFFDQLTPGHVLGNVVAILSGLFMALMYMNLGSCPETERMSSILIGQTLTFLCGVPLLFTTHPAFSALPVLYVVILGVVQLGIPYVLCARAAEHCPPLACSLLGALEPLLNPIWVFLFDGEAPGVFALAGGAVVIVTVTLWCIFGQRAPEAV
ncbi:MAG: DMT family transporter [Clostridiales bacterium]|nr:DMT family transporter [Clostridiales bacterium]MDD6935379.1 DMT family transporter [Clostridiales bacterium]MDY2961843.1 DMT family transporter [Oscillospiraceae bacterium]